MLKKFNWSFRNRPTIDHAHSSKFLGVEVYRGNSIEVKIKTRITAGNGIFYLNKKIQDTINRGNKTKKYITRMNPNIRM